MLTSDINQQQYSDFDAIERACSVFSLLGCIFVITTFLCSRSFRKPITRLVFYASFGNLLTNVATIMARSYVSVPTSPACQFQGFLIQMFMPADAYWTLAMAVNVYLTFYRKYDAQMLKKMEKYYFVLCYGLPFIIAITFIFIDDRQNGRMYGDALLWCWVSSGWDIWRIVTFYGPVWLTIFVTFFIYIRTGRQIYLKYRTLRSVNSQSREPEPLLITEPFSTKTTEVYVTSEIVSSSAGIEPIGNRISMAVGVPQPAYTVEITSQGKVVRKTVPADNHEDNDDGDEDEEDVEMEDKTSGMDDEPTPPSSPTSPTAVKIPQSPISPISERSTTTNSMRILPEKSRRSRRRLAIYEANNAAWSYTKCALLFFSALLVTWIPSTANRLYPVIHDQQIVLGLEYASAFVLPLQGFWNGLIYVFTTRRACKKLIENAIAYLSERDTTKSKEARDKRVVHVEDRQDSWSRGGRQPGRDRDRNSRMMGFVPSNGKPGLGLPIEAYERI